MSNKLELADHRRNKAAACVLKSIGLLQVAQEEITNVEGEGSSDIYSEIADAYDALRPLVAKLERLQVTGIFE